MTPEESLEGIKNSYPFIKKLAEIILDFLRDLAKIREKEIY